MRIEGFSSVLFVNGFTFPVVFHAILDFIENLNHLEKFHDNPIQEDVYHHRCHRTIAIGHRCHIIVVVA